MSHRTSIERYAAEVASAAVASWPGAPEDLEERDALAARVVACVDPILERLVTEVISDISSVITRRLFRDSPVAAALAGSMARVLAAPLVVYPAQETSGEKGAASVSGVGAPADAAPVRERVAE